MPVESPVNYVSDLVPTNPIGATDPKSQGDDHIRNIKLALKQTFPNLSAAVTSDPTELNLLDGATGLTGTGNTVRSASPTFTGTVNVAALTASGVLLGSAGSAAAPAFAFSGDSDTGLFSSGLGKLNFATDGVQRVLIDSLQLFTNGLQFRSSDGSAAAPVYSFDSDLNTGIFRAGVDNMRLAAGGVSAMGFLSTHLEPFLPLQSADGTAAAPTYTFSNDPDTGMYRASPNELGLTTGGAVRVLLDPNGQRGPDGSAATPGYSFLSDTDTGFYRLSADAIGVTVGGALVAQFRSAATGSLDIKDDDGDLRTVGYRDIPRRTVGFQRGEMLAISAGVTLNTSDMAAGYAFSIYNDSAAAITITQGAGVTLRLAGTTATGNRTIPARGVATVWCNSGTEAVISGAAVS